MNKLKSVGECILYIIIVYLSQKITYYIYSFILLNWIQDQDKAFRMLQDTKVVYIIIGWVLSLILIYVSIGFSQKDHRPKLFKPLGLQNLLFSIIIGFGMVFLANGIIQFLGKYFSLELFFMSSEIKFYDNILFSMLTIGCIIPIMEEVFFRGLILDKLMELGFAPLAILIQSILFSISHFNMVQSGYGLLLGLGAGYATVKTGSIKSAICIHVLFNSTNIYLAYMNQTYYSIGQLFMFILIGALLLALGMDRLEKPIDTPEPNNLL